MNGGSILNQVNIHQS